MLPGHSGAKVGDQSVRREVWADRCGQIGVGRGYHEVGEWGLAVYNFYRKLVNKVSLD